MAKLLDRLHRAWFHTTLFGVVSILAVRNLAFLPQRLPEAIDRPIGVALAYQGMFDRLQIVLVPLTAVLGALVALVLLARPRWCFPRSGEGRRIAPWLLSLLWFELLFNNFLLDMSPRLALVAFLSLLALWPVTWDWIAQRSPLAPSRTRIALWVVPITLEKPPQAEFFLARTLNLSIDR